MGDQQESPSSQRSRSIQLESSSTVRTHTGRIGLVALFVTALITAQLTASKLLLFTLPVRLPIVETSILIPGAAIAYAITFFASDCYAELYGKRAAQVMVNIGFGMNIVLLALVWSTLLAPAADPSTAAQYRAVLAPGTNVIIGSLAAYIISQNWDVIVFHWVRTQTNGAHLWLRNISSTATSQAIDTVLFVIVAFALAPQLLALGETLSMTVIVSLITGQYLLKLLVALVDTPFIYLIVSSVDGSQFNRRGETDTAD